MKELNVEKRLKRVIGSTYDNAYLVIEKTVQNKSKTLKPPRR